MSEVSNTIVVVGGAGAMGRITVKDLFETSPGDTKIVIADRNGAAARKLAKSCRSKRVVAAEVDVTDVRATAKRLRGTFAAICSVQ